MRLINTNGNFDLKTRTVNHHKQGGLTLIEAVVSLFVFAVGALGVAALQTTSLIRGDDTKQRSIALWKAQELADRIRSTKTIDDPDGLVQEYIDAIGNTNADNGIGVVDATDEYDCSPAAPTRCDDVDGISVGACTAAQIVAFDIWSVMCDANTGLTPVIPADPTLQADGLVGLRNLEVALEANGNGYRLYFEWLSRSANNNLDTQGVDTGLQNTDGTARNIVANLCGEDENIDTRLDVYCLRFQ